MIILSSPAIYRQCGCGIPLHQITHYVRYASGDKALLHIVEGVLRRQAHMVLIDPYANAFNEHPNGHCFARDLTEMHPFVWERKYEVDSLCAPIYLLHHYWKTTGLTGAFDAQTYAMLVRICEVFSLEQHHENSPYSFERQNCVETDTLPCAGRGNTCCLYRNDLVRVSSIR